MVRKSKWKPEKQVIGIYCEGSSEVTYFNMLRRKYHGGNVQAHRAGLKIVAMDSEKGTKLITDVIKQVNALKKQRKVDVVFAVFDRDDLTREDIQRAQALARQNNIKIIFSSINFEIWILLHFEFFTRAYTRTGLNTVLSDSRHFNQDYSRFKGNEYDQLLVDKVATAIKNGRQLARRQTDLLTADPFVNIQDHIREIFGRED